MGGQLYSESAETRDALFDILRGVSRLTGNGLVGDLAKLAAEGFPPEFHIAFNHKQIASKLWLRDALFDVWGGAYRRVMVVGGWYGVLASILLDDPRFSIELVESLDVDPACAPIALSLNRRHASRGSFQARTADMMEASYLKPEAGDVTVNTSCEHIADLRGWLARLGRGARVILQSNDYRREPDHIACVDTLDEFEQLAGLTEVLFRGALPTKNYTRWMLIGFV